jgi:hypothetical protein
MLDQPLLVRLQPEHPEMDLFLEITCLTSVVLVALLQIIPQVELVAQVETEHRGAGEVAVAVSIAHPVDLQLVATVVLVSCISYLGNPINKR